MWVTNRRAPRGEHHTDGMKAPTVRLPDITWAGSGVWEWDGWWWDHRSLGWLPRYHNRVLEARVVCCPGYYAVTGRGRAYGTGDTFNEAWSAMVSREFAKA